MTSPRPDRPDRPDGAVVASLREVSRRYRSGPEIVTALDAVTLDVVAGRVIGVAGPSGSGKSTLLNLLVGWDRPDEGTVDRLDEGSSWDACAVVPQDLGLVPELTAAENVELAVAIRGRRHADGPTAEQLLASLGLDELLHRLPDQLSLGQQQRVAVARAAIGTPTLVVADEPTAHQDERHADVVVEVLHDLARRGSGVVVATHDERLLSGFDEVVRIDDGRLVEPGATG